MNMIPSSRHQCIWVSVALWLQAGLACAATIYLETFEALMGGFVFTMWIFYGLAAVVIIILRVRLPGAERPYRCWGYPWMPIIFTLVAAGMTVLSIAESPRATLPWLGVLLVGAPVYSIWKRAARASDAEPPAA